MKGQRTRYEMDGFIVIHLHLIGHRVWRRLLFSQLAFSLFSLLLLMVLAVCNSFIVLLLY